MATLIKRTQPGPSLLGNETAFTPDLTIQSQDPPVIFSQNSSMSGPTVRTQYSSVSEPEDRKQSWLMMDEEVNLTPNL